MMADIAALAGVSESTVSRALAGNPLVAEKTRQLIAQLAKSHGYAVNPAARSLRRGNTQTIAVMIPLTHASRQHVSDAFFAEMLSSLAEALNERGYDLLFHRISADHGDWIGAPIQTRRADGVIIIGQSLEHEAMNRAALAGVPLVVWGAKLPNQHYVSVGVDNFQGGVLGTSHLLARGRRRIAFLGDTRVPEVMERRRGYAQTLCDAGIDLDPGLELQIQFGAEEAVQVLRDVVQAGRGIDGVVAASDTLALSAIRELTHSGLNVPKDVSVVGFDDIPLASYTLPPLTTIRQEIAPGAILLVEKLLAILAGEPVESEQMSPTLIVRGSS